MKQRFGRPISPATSSWVKPIRDRADNISRANRYSSSKASYDFRNSFRSGLFKKGLMIMRNRLIGYFIHSEPLSSFAGLTAGLAPGFLAFSLGGRGERQCAGQLQNNKRPARCPRHGVSIQTDLLLMVESEGSRYWDQSPSIIPPSGRNRPADHPASPQSRP